MDFICGVEHAQRNLELLACMINVFHTRSCSMAPAWKLHWRHRSLWTTHTGGIQLRNRAQPTAVRHLGGPKRFTKHLQPPFTPAEHSLVLVCTLGTTCRDFLDTRERGL